MQTHTAQKNTDFFPETLRIAGELDWVYTTSRRVAQFFDLPHQEVRQVIEKLINDLISAGTNKHMDFDLFRFAVMSPGQRDIESGCHSEWLLSRNSFLLLATNLGGRAATTAQKLMVGQLQQTQGDIDRLNKLIQTVKA